MIALDAAATAAIPAADQGAARRLLLAAIVGRRSDGWLELRYKRERDGGMARAWHTVGGHAAAADHAGYLGARTDVYVGALPRGKQDGRAEACADAWVLWADADTPEAVAALATFQPSPTFVVGSGSQTGGVAHCHGWWALRAPLAVGDVKRATRRLAHALGADMGATDVARILRVPGTQNFKTTPPAAVMCVHATADVHDAADVVGHLPDLPGRPVRPPAAAALHRDDPLRAIAASEYVPALIGRPVGADGKAACPFHAGGEERTPSLHAYDDPARGWVCFGCNAGGSIIDLGARLYGIEPRGRGYHDIRRRLARDLLTIGRAA